MRGVLLRRRAAARSTTAARATARLAGVPVIASLSELPALI